MNDLFKARGVHSLLDYTNCIISDKNVEAVMNNLLFNIKLICNKNGLRIVGEKSVLFDGTKSPTGFTAICLLDESHISVHSYAKEGLMAWDLFTCCKNPGNHIMALSDIKNVMEITFPDLALIKQEGIARFLTSPQLSLNQESISDD